jgi:cation:H+ antiporter
MPDLADLPAWAVALVFATAAAVVWAAGVRLATFAEEVAKRTGLGRAFIGALLLGGVTSLPEGATTVSASAIGNAPLAVNNIFGGIALQVAVLALADWVARGRALSSRVGDDTVLLQAALLVGVLGVAITGILLPDPLVLGVGVASVATFLSAVAAFFLIHRHRTPGRWLPSGAPVQAGGEAETPRHRRPPGRGADGGVAGGPGAAAWPGGAGARRGLGRGARPLPGRRRHALRPQVGRRPAAAGVYQPARSTRSR